MRILLTGANGNMGEMIRPMLRERYGELILNGRGDPPPLEAGETYRRADLGEPEPLAAALDGVDGVIHLAGQAVEAEWETVNAANIQGLFNLYEAARAQGVRRIVFASSVHAVGFYPRHRRIGIHDPVRPDTRYGLSKAFGEGLASLYADKFGLRTLSVRIGYCDWEPTDLRRHSIWLHPEDFVQLCVIGLEHPDIHNQIVFGASANVRNFWDNAPAFRLGYRPKHDAEAYPPEPLAGKTEPDRIADLFEGGPFVSEEFDGDLERTLWSQR